MIDIIENEKHNLELKKSKIMICIPYPKDKCQCTAVVTKGLFLNNFSTLKSSKLPQTPRITYMAI